MPHALLPMAYGSQKKKKGANTEICKNGRGSNARRQVYYHSWSFPVKKDDSSHLYERWQMGQ